MPASPNHGLHRRRRGSYVHSTTRVRRSQDALEALEASKPSWLRDVENLRMESIVYEERRYHLYTNAAPQSRELKLETRENKIIFFSVRKLTDSSEFPIATLKWKLENDIFSLYGDEGVAPLEDNQLCDALELIATLLAVDLIIEPWDDSIAYSPVLNCDLGGGDFIHVETEESIVGQEHGGKHEDTPGSTPIYTQDSQDRERADVGTYARQGPAVRHLDRFGRREFIRFVREIEAFAAEHVFKSIETLAMGIPVASIIGSTSHVSNSQVFSPRVPTVYGLFVTKFISFKERLAIPKKSSLLSHSRTSNSSSNSLSDSSMPSEENDGFGRDIEQGMDNCAEENNIASDPNQKELAQAGPRLGGSPTGHESEKLQDTQKSKDDEDLETLSPSQTLATTNDYQKVEEQSSSQSLTPDVPLTPPVKQTPPEEHSAPSEDFENARAADLAAEIRLLRNVSAENVVSANLIAKELLSYLLFSIAILLAAATVAFDPAGEENWFKRIEEGVFVLFSILAPTILAMDSRLTENLDVIMPERSRDVRSLKDLRNQKKDIDDETFLARISEAILLDENISNLFSFKNACYKLTRNDGPLIIPGTVKYSGVFMRIWMFGGNLCINRLTGETFRYVHDDGMLLIERKPVADVEGVIVHLRRRQEEYRIGADPGK